MESLSVMEYGLSRFSILEMEALDSVSEEVLLFFANFYLQLMV